MKSRALVILVVSMVVSGCVSYGAVYSGTVAVGGLKVSPGITWNKAPASQTPNIRKSTQVWTQDGLLLNRLLIIPAVPNGEPLLRDRKKRAALPAFRADMLPNELEELTESSIVKLYGEGNAAVTTSNLRPHHFGTSDGILLDFNASVSDGPDYKGLVGAFIANELLYMMIYVAAEPYYYGKHADEAKSIIETATL